MKIGSLFSGYGGLDAAVEHVFDAETVWVSDISPGACKVLAHRFPHAPNLGDISAIDWATVEPVDIIAGGSPCQDLSTAGRRAGMSDGTRSNLWVMMREAIAQVRPTYVCWENVRGAFSARAASAMESDPRLLGDHPADKPALRALGRVLGDLADLGYDAAWCGLPASAVGAPHERFRVFVLARPSDTSSSRGAQAVEHDGHRPPTSDRTSVPDQRGSHAHGPRPDRTTVDWGQYGPAIHRWEQVTGNPAPHPTSPSPRTGHPQLSAEFPEWMMGLPPGWITDTPGVSRTEALQLAGNGVVPQQAAAAYRHLRPLLEGAGL